MRDEETGVYWTATRSPIREDRRYRARHGAGYTVFEHNSHGIEQELTVFVPVDEDGGKPIKLQRLLLRNDTSRSRTHFPHLLRGVDAGREPRVHADACHSLVGRRRPGSDCEESLSPRIRGSGGVCCHQPAHAGPSAATARPSSGETVPWRTLRPWSARAFLRRTGAGNGSVRGDADNRRDGAGREGRCHLHAGPGRVPGGGARPGAHASGRCSRADYAWTGPAHGGTISWGWWRCTPLSLRRTF